VRVLAASWLEAEPDRGHGQAGVGSFGDVTAYGGARAWALGAG
jgi:hypothetical protein